MPSIIGLLTLPIISRILTPDDYGKLAIITSFTELISIVAGLQISSGVYKYYFDHNKSENRIYFSTLVYILFQ